MQQATVTTSTRNSLTPHRLAPVQAGGPANWVLPPLTGMAAGQWYNFVHSFEMLLEMGEDDENCNWQVLAYTPVGNYHGLPGCYTVTLQPVPMQPGMNNVEIVVSPEDQCGVIATWG